MSRLGVALLLLLALLPAPAPSRRWLVQHLQSAASASGQLTVAWDANNPAEHVLGYIIETNILGDRAHATQVDVGNVLIFTVSGLQAGAVYEVRAYAYANDESGAQLTSPPSDAITGTPPPPFVCSAVPDASASQVVSIIINDFDPIVARSDPKGLLVRFDAGSSDPITRIELSLEGNGEPAVPLVFPVGVGFDGRYVRALAFKPTINGTFPLLLKAEDSSGRHNAVRCLPGVAVSF